MSERKQQNTMSRMNPETTGREGLVDINGVNIDPELPYSEKMLRYLEQMKDPYCFLCGDTPVKISFASDGEELKDVLKKYFMALK